jgi:hypothetical protein
MLIMIKQKKFRSSYAEPKTSRGTENYVRNPQNPAIWPLSGLAPGTALQIEVTAWEGPRIRVVPVSMAANVELPILTGVPFTLTTDEIRRIR